MDANDEPAYRAGKCNCGYTKEEQTMKTEKGLSDIRKIFIREIKRSNEGIKHVRNAIKREEARHNTVVSINAARLDELTRKIDECEAHLATLSAGCWVNKTEAKPK